MRSLPGTGALRRLGKSPAHALAFVLTLGIGIGATTAIFSLVQAVLLAPLPYRDGNRLVYLRQSAELADLDNVLFSVPEISDVRERSRTLAEVAEFSSLPFVQIGWGEPRQIRAGIVTGNYFETMGLRALTGRVIGPDDDGPTAAPVAVLTAEYWARGFGSDPAAIGTTVRLDGREATIVGVAEPAPPYPEETDLYVNLATSPHHLGATMVHDRTHRMTEVFARLAPGATIDGARAELLSLHAQLVAEHPEAYDPTLGYRVSLRTLSAQLGDRARGSLLLLFGVTGFVFLLAAANTVNLTLVRLVRRAPELALREALGASRLRIRAEVLGESLVLSTGGVVLGILVAAGAMHALSRFAASLSTRAVGVQLQPRALLFASVCGLAVAVAAALLPPLHASGRVAGSGRGGEGRESRRLQRGLVVTQIALSFALLSGAGLFGRALWRAVATDLGVERSHLVVADLPTVSSGLSVDETTRYYEEIVKRVERLPGVRSAGLTTRAPLRPTTLPFDWTLEFAPEGADPGADATRPRADFRPVTPGVFETLGLPVVDGVLFDDGADATSEPVVVVNRALAERFFPGGAVGKTLRWTDPTFRFIGVSDAPRRVAAVVEDSRDWGIDAPVLPTIYMPFAQAPVARALVVRTGGPPERLVAAIRSEIRAIGPEQPIERVATMERIIDDSLGPRRLNATLIGGFAVLSLLLAALGLAGLVGFGVARRIHEFGVRLALGARPDGIVRLVLIEGVGLALAGLALGVPLALATNHFAAASVAGIEPLDPAVWAAAATTLATVGLVSAVAPALRAAAADPLSALRRR